MNEKIVPNVGLIAREMTTMSQIAMILRRFLALSLISKLKLAVNNIRFLSVLAKMDFAAGIKVLCELEILKLSEKEKKLGCVVLHNQMVDMALALGNKRVIWYFLSLAKTYKFTPGIRTYNTSMMIKYLSGLPKLPDNLVIYAPLAKDSAVVTDYVKSGCLNFVNIE